MPAHQTHTDTGPGPQSDALPGSCHRRAGPTSARARCSTAWPAAAHALVADTPGVTRDRKEADGPVLRGRTVRLIDTAGPGGEPHPTRSTTACAPVLAGGGGRRPTSWCSWSTRAPASRPADSHFAAWLRRQGRPVLLVANKTEGRGGAQPRRWRRSTASGLGDPVAVSRPSTATASSGLMGGDRRPPAQGGARRPRRGRRAGRGGRRGRHRAAPPAAPRDRRAPQRRQVHACSTACSARSG